MVRCACHMGGTVYAWIHDPHRSNQPNNSDIHPPDYRQGERQRSLHLGDRSGIEFLGPGRAPRRRSRSEARGSCRHTNSPDRDSMDLGRTVRNDNDQLQPARTVDMLGRRRLCRLDRECCDDSVSSARFPGGFRRQSLRRQQAHNPRRNGRRISTRRRDAINFRRLDNRLDSSRRDGFGSTVRTPTTDATAGGATARGAAAPRSHPQVICGAAIPRELDNTTIQQTTPTARMTCGADRVRIIRMGTTGIFSAPRSHYREGYDLQPGNTIHCAVKSVIHPGKSWSGAFRRRQKCLHQTAATWFPPLPIGAGRRSGRSPPRVCRECWQASPIPRRPGFRSARRPPSSVIPVSPAVP